MKHFRYIYIYRYILLVQCAASNKSGSSSSTGDGNQSQTPRPLVDAQKFQMMDGAVQPARIEPFVVAENERYYLNHNECLKIEDKVVSRWTNFNTLIFFQEGTDF